MTKKRSEFRGTETPPQTPPHKGEGLNPPPSQHPTGEASAGREGAWGVVSKTDWPLPLVGRGFGARFLQNPECSHV
jgi:hypothetical protein